MSQTCQDRRLAGCHSITSLRGDWPGWMFVSPFKPKSDSATHRRAGHKDRCSVLTRLTPWSFAMKTPSQWTGGRNVDISRVPSSGRTLYIDPAAEKPTRPWHRRDTRQHRIDGGALFIVDCDPYQRPPRMLTAILRGCESVDFGDFDTSAFSADLGQARDRWPGTSG
jgi:hypothetical protein